MRLGERVWTEVGRATVLVPVGSLEQHGPHLPLDTDARIAAVVRVRQRCTSRFDWAPGSNTSA